VGGSERKGIDREERDSERRQKRGRYRVRREVDREE